MKISSAPQVQAPQNNPPKTANKPAQDKPSLQESAAMAKDGMSWSSASKMDRVKAATIENFKATALPYTIGGAVAVPLAGAAFGAFVGLFGGQPMEGAKAGFTATLKYAPIGAAAGLGISTVESGVVGTVVGTSPDKSAAMTRMGGLTAIVGILTAEDSTDLLMTGVDTAHQSIKAGEIFDKAQARIEGK